MYYLGIDTSNKFIIVSIFNDNEVLYFKKTISDRNASELINQFIEAAFKTVAIKVNDLSGVVVVSGPGSFTGVRIAMTVAKVLSFTLDIPLYSISAFVYYAGLVDATVILDARSNKAYLGKVSAGKLIKQQLLKLDEIELSDNMIGDLELLNKANYYGNLKNNFLVLKAYWEPQSNLDAKPTYLKSVI